MKTGSYRLPILATSMFSLRTTLHLYLRSAYRRIIPHVLRVLPRTTLTLSHRYPTRDNQVSLHKCLGMGPRRILCIPPMAIPTRRHSLIGPSKERLSPKYPLRPLK